MNDPVDDAFYVRRVLEGDRDAFRVLVDRYSGLVYRIAYSMLRNTEGAKDAVQEVFYRVFKGLASYDPGRPLKTWINRVTVNYILDQRKKRRITACSMTDQEENVINVPDSTYDPRDQHSREERDACVLRAIDQLPDKYKIVLMMRHMENMSYEEIAQALSLPVGTVMTHIHRARVKLSEMLQPLQAELLS
ncbi:MAG TPA: sigma-70 family RNA polymerase sigma factor [bacterium]|nr:sigma-70 family RNA polymerase sigma factor [bacterium]